ncbi:hypothetical protein [Ruegeria arenilitoris]|uniref:hypothetical protein n=1 Tax=Ruegeria arenilitoris TaxID=1173585 RepID=UPI00147CD8E8|nr:hypothetical protein [Ruegeria arenilitoris]
MIEQAVKLMQQSVGMDKLGPVVTVVRFVWAIRNIIAIVSLLCTVGYLLFSETLEQRRYMLSQFAKVQADVTEAEGHLKLAGDLAFREPSRTGASIPVAIAAQLEEAVRALRSELLSAPAPTSRIEKTRTAYAAALVDVLGAINLYEPGGDGEKTIAVLTSLHALETPATAYKQAARKYQTSVWNSFWAAF